uniref:Alpha-defensin N-terminal domain-containing protein n=1 Tax=Oryctolagus cuniculus TaxID=9986 RepID=A0A5F9CK72_RABIT
MRTHTLLSAIVLVALQAQAEPFSPRTHVAPAQEHPKAEDKLVAVCFVRGGVSYVNTASERCRHGKRCAIRDMLKLTYLKRYS